jgi:hypothetical protein
MAVSRRSLQMGSKKGWFVKITLGVGIGDPKASKYQLI